MNKGNDNVMEDNGLENHIAHTAEEYDTMSDNDMLREIDERLRRIENALMSDNEMGSIGVIQRIDKTEDLALENKKKLNKLLWIASGAGATAAIIFELTASFLF